MQKATPLTPVPQDGGGYGVLDGVCAVVGTVGRVGGEREPSGASGGPIKHGVTLAADLNRLVKIKQDVRGGYDDASIHLTEQAQ